MKSASLRTKKGVIEVDIEVSDDYIQAIKITGDFFIYPEDAIEDFEQQLQGVKIDRVQLHEAFAELYSQQELSTPGITIDDWVEVVLKAINS